MADITTPRLPPELLDNIVDELQNLRLGAPDAITRRKYWDALRTCILVSKEFRYRSLKHVYECVCIYNAQFGRGVARQVSIVASELRKIMDPPPHFALGGVGSYITTVSLSFAIYALQHSVHASEQVKEFLDDENLLFVLRKLHEQVHGITRFALNLSVGHYFTPRGVSWSDLSSSFQKIFCSLANSPHLRSLEVKNVNHIPLSLLRNRHLHSLHLQQNIYDTTGAAPPPLPSHASLVAHPHTTSLNKFWTDHSYRYSDIIPLALADSLECLEATNTVITHVLETWDIVEMATQSLRCLKIVYSGESTGSRQLHFFRVLRRDDRVHSGGVSPLTLFDIGQIPHLEKFSHVHNGIFRYSRPNYPGLVTLVKLLETSTPMCHLHTINLCFQFEEIGPQEDFIDPKQEPQWQLLDNILSGPMYPSLREVTIKISVNAIVAYSPDFNSERFMSITATPLQDSFPKLISSEHISFDLKLDLSIDPQDFPI